jgi:hypothetical protein
MPIANPDPSRIRVEALTDSAEIGRPMQMTTEAAEVKLHDGAADAVDTVPVSRDQGSVRTAPSAGSASAGLGHAIDEQAEARVNEMVAHAAEVALGSGDAQHLPPEMLGPAKAVLQDLGSQVARRAIAGAAETAQKQIDGPNANKAPSPQHYDALAKKALAGVKEMAADAAESAPLAAAVAAMPPEKRGPAEGALRSLGWQVALNVSSAIADAAQTVHGQLFDVGGALGPSGIERAAEAIIKLAAEEIAGQVVKAAPFEYRALVQVILAVVFILVGLVPQMSLQALGSQMASRVGLGNRGRLRPQIDGANAEPGRK